MRHLAKVDVSVPVDFSATLPPVTTPKHISITSVFQISVTAEDKATALNLADTMAQYMAKGDYGSGIGPPVRIIQLATAVPVK